MIKKQIAVILILCLFAMMLTATVFAVEPSAPTVSGAYIYANGTALIIEGTDSEHTTVYIDTNRNGTVDVGEKSLKSAGIGNAPNDGVFLASWTVFGGAFGGNFVGDSMITVNGGSVGDVFGGAGGSSAGNVTLVLNGGSVKRLIATGNGGSNVGGTGCTVSIAIHGGYVRGGANDDVDMLSRIASGTEKSLVIDGGTVNGTVVGATPTNGEEAVIKTTLTLMDGETAKANTAVTALTLTDGAYGMSDALTNSSGQLIVYLPEGKTVTAATVGEHSYTGSVVAGNTGELSKVMPPMWTDGISANPSAAFSGGSGTEASPYLLSSAEDLAQLAVNVNTRINCYTANYFKLTQNIDLGGKNWVPIGFTDNARYAFRGYFDGSSHIISNMYIDYSVCGNTYNYLGFFGWIYGGNNSGYDGNGASVKNLALTNSSINIDEIMNSGSVGILIGFADRGITIENCFATGNISATEAVENIGGLIGKNANGTSGSMTNCYYIGNIMSVNGTNVGSILGLRASTSPVNCYAAATITSYATNKYAVASSATNCYYDSTLNTTAIDGEGTPKITEQMKTQETATALGTAWGYNEGINGGYPYLVSMNYTPEITLTENSVSVKNLNEDASLVLASYENGRLLDIIILPVNLPEDIDISGTGLITEGADKIKAMLWNDMENMHPLCKSSSVLYGSRVVYEGTKILPTLNGSVATATSYAVNDYARAAMLTYELGQLVADDGDGTTPTSFDKIKDNIENLTQAQAMITNALEAWDRVLSSGAALDAVVETEILRLIDEQQLFSVMSEEETSDPLKWAQSITDQFDAFDGNNKIKQLANNMGCDAKRAYAYYEDGSASVLSYYFYTTASDGGVPVRWREVQGTDMDTGIITRYFNEYYDGQDEVGGIWLKSGRDCTYYTNGMLEYSTVFSVGKATGVSYYYTSGGVLKSISNYSNDNLEGMQTLFYTGEEHPDVEYIPDGGPESWIGYVFAENWYENGVSKAHRNYTYRINPDTGDIETEMYNQRGVFPDGY